MGVEFLSPFIVVAIVVWCVYKVVERAIDEVRSVGTRHGPSVTEVPTFPIDSHNRRDT